MPTPTVVLTGLAAYAGQRDKQLIMQLLRGMTVVNDAVLMTGIKSKKQLTKLTVASRMRPYSNTFTATDSGAAFSDRELDTHLGKGEWLIDVQEFLGTYLEENQPDGVAKPEQAAVPFSTQFWNQQMAACATDLDLNTVWGGVYNKTGTTAKDIADGYGTILTRELAANKLVANATGAITPEDAVEQVEFMYRRHDAKYRQMAMNVYMSYHTYDLYCDNYRERFKVRSLPDNFLQTSVDASGGKCFLKPVLWMGDSDRLMVTPKENLLIGTDRLSDLNTIRTQPDMWVLKAGVAVNIGFQFRDLEVLQVNDVD